MASHLESSPTFKKANPSSAAQGSKQKAPNNHTRDIHTVMVLTAPHQGKPSTREDHDEWGRIDQWMNGSTDGNDSSWYSINQSSKQAMESMESSCIGRSLVCLVMVWKGVLSSDF